MQIKHTPLNIPDIISAQWDSAIQQQQKKNAQELPEEHDKKLKVSTWYRSKSD